MFNLTNRKRPSKKWLIRMGGAVVISVIVFGISIFTSPEEKNQGGSAKTNAMRPKAATNTTVGNSPVTDVYNEKLKEQNKKQTEQAIKEGKSSIPTVMGERRPTAVKKVEKKEEPPKEVPETKRTPSRKAPTTTSYNKRDDDAKTMKEYMALLLKDTKHILGSETYQPAAKTNFAVVKTTDNKTDAAKVGENNHEQHRRDQENQLPELPFKSGDLLYASNEIYLNSDVPSPVVVSIVSGAFKDTMFFGNFKRHEKYMLLQFDRLRTPAGDEYPVNAIALDPYTNSAAVRSSVDSHYLQRWGGLIAASFIEGFGEARSRSGQSYQTSETTETISYPEYDVEDEAWIAAGTVGKRLANIMEKAFDRDPTIYEYTGEMLAIMILSTKR